MLAIPLELYLIMRTQKCYSIITTDLPHADSFFFSKSDNIWNSDQKGKKVKKVKLCLVTIEYFRFKAVFTLFNIILITNPSVKKNHAQ